jgi:hypothetical protein
MTSTIPALYGAHSLRLDNENRENKCTESCTGNFWIREREQVIVAMSRPQLWTETLHNAVAGRRCPPLVRYIIDARGQRLTSDDGCVHFNATIIQRARMRNQAKPASDRTMLNGRRVSHVTEVPARRIL